MEQGEASSLALKRHAIELSQELADVIDELHGAGHTFWIQISVVDHRVVGIQPTMRIDPRDLRPVGVGG